MTITARQPATDTPLTLDDLPADTCSVEEAAQVLGLGRNLAYELARRGELPGVLRLGRRLRVSVPALRRALGVEPGQLL